MKAESLAIWIASATVDKHTKENKEVFVATKGNEQLILICHRVRYSHELPVRWYSLVPHINVVWVDSGIAVVLYQDILDATYGQVKHGTGELEGEHTARENVETIWCALVAKLKDNPVQKVTFKQAWAVHQNDDDRSSGVPTFWFDDEESARLRAIGIGWYGGNAPVSQHTIIVIPAQMTDSGYEEYYVAEKVDLNEKEYRRNEDLKKQALNKLTLDEKKALGI